MADYQYVAPVWGTWAAKASSPFGAARSGGRRNHAGNDLQARNGTPAVASIGGKVIYAGHNQGYQWNAVVLGDDGNAYRYATHGPLSVKLGQRVEQGQPVGTIARGHLHFEVIPQGSPALKQMMARPGQFVSTQWWPGNRPVTVDPAKFFGVSKGAKIAAGKPVGNPALAYAEPEVASDPFGVGAFQAARLRRFPGVRAAAGDAGAPTSWPSPEEAVSMLQAAGFTGPDAIEKFQESMGGRAGPVDGIIGRRTLGALMNPDTPDIYETAALGPGLPPMNPRRNGANYPLTYQPRPPGGGGRYVPPPTGEITQDGANYPLTMINPNPQVQVPQQGMQVGDRAMDQAPPRNLRMWDQGDDVAEVQTKLQAMGIDPGKIDGVYGPKTIAAVTQYQSLDPTKVGGKVDGIAGPMTQGALSRDFSGSWMGDQNLRTHANAPLFADWSMDREIPDAQLPYETAAPAPGLPPPSPRRNEPGFSGMVQMGRPEPNPNEWTQWQNKGSHPIWGETPDMSIMDWGYLTDRKPISQDVVNAALNNEPGGGGLVVDQTGGFGPPSFLQEASEKSPGVTAGFVQSEGFGKGPDGTTYNEQYNTFQ